MTIFKTFTLKWWQGALFKWGVFLLGIAVGAFWPALFSAYIPIILIVAAVFLVYVTVIWWKQ